MKALGLFLGAVLAISLAGCGDDGGSGGSGGSTGGSGGSTGGSGGSTGGAAGLSCDDYCAEMATNCTGDSAQFGSDAACKGVCATFAQGTANDTTGATLGCRLYHGGSPAKSEPALHCPHAGPLGDGTCGGDCENFCEIAVAVCGSQATPPYADKDACLTACMTFPDTTAVPYNAQVTSGDSLACRMYHLSTAAKSATDAETHCPHVAATSSACM